MHLRIYISFLFLIFSISIAYSQDNPAVDSIRVRNEKLQKEIYTELEKLTLSAPEDHSPRKATIYSAILPGLGQAYNKRYWKIPIIYAGLGTIAYFAKWNNDRYKLYKHALFARVDGDPDTVSPLPDRISTDAIRRGAEFYRRNKELNIIVFAAVWGLNVLDAHIDAHLIGFDLSEDIALQVKPHVGQTDFSAKSINAGLSISLKFKK
jgi:hypothetical protein